MKKCLVNLLFLLVGTLALFSSSVSAQERLCDPSFEDCRTPLWQLIDNETVGIDVAFWFMQDTSFANKIIARHNAGVPVRVLVDPRANEPYPGNGQVLDMLAAAGIPMRKNVWGGILHWKMMMFVGQNKVQFSGANYSAHFFVPTQPYTNYIDEAIYFTDDPAVVNSFKTKYDDLWIDTIRYANYANITSVLMRRYPTFPIDPEMNFPPDASGDNEFVNRATYAYNQETQKIDVIMYRITDRRHTDGLIAAKNRGLTVRLLTEPNEYRNPNKFWHSWNVDRMYMAGIQIKQRKPSRLGLNHEKAVLLYNQGMTIFGSSNWTTSSSNSQEEHNYFTRKVWFFNWFVEHFERKWNSPTENEDFVPLPPDSPVIRFPDNNATGVATNLTLRWEGGLYAHKYDVYFGTDPNPPLVAANHMVHIDSVYPGTDETFQLPPLSPGTTYYWRIVSKTMADQGAPGPVWRFSTAGTAPPPSDPPVVNSVSPNTGGANGGTVVTISGTRFAAGASVTFGGVPATSVTVTSDTQITAQTPMHAEGVVDVVVTNVNNLSGTLTNGFTYTSATPQPNASDVVLYAAEAAVKVGSWTVVTDATAAGGSRLANADAGAPKLPNALANPAHYFEMTFQAEAGRGYRLWLRGKALNDFYGNDSVWVQFSDSVDSQGVPQFRINTASGEGVNLEDCSGCGLSGWGWQDNGWGIGTLGPLFYFQNTGTHTIRIQPREDGLSIDQIVLSPETYLNQAPGALKDDGTILPKPGGPPPQPPTVTSVSPNTGTTAGGTAVTITGTNFASGAAVTFGGASATNVSVASATQITATTPPHAAGAVNIVVTNPGGLSSTLNDGFTYETPPANQPPQVSITATPDSGFAPLAVSFASSASDPDGQVVSYNWNFGDGGTSTVASPSHTYQTSGTYTAQLTVTDNQGATASASTVINVSDAPPLQTPEAVLYAAEAAVKVGSWTVVTDATAAGGSRLANADAGAPKLGAPLASPAHYFEMTFEAAAGRGYRLWIRGKAQNDFWGNDSVWVQFSDSVTSANAPAYRIGTTTGADINLEDCSGCGLSGWGWQDNGWGIGVMGPLIYFQNSGTHTIRVQPREDGLSIDQIVLSAQAYVNSPPGATRNDNTILPKTGGGGPPPVPAPTITSVTPNSGTTAGGTAVTITGTNFASGAAVTIGGASATNVSVASATQITATTPPHAAGAVNIIVTNPDNQSATLTNGFTYQAPGAPLPAFSRVFVVVEENHRFSEVIGSAAMPYLNTLASRYGLAVNYFANTQPSIGNYFWMTTGQVITNDANFAGTVTVDNIVRQLSAAGKTWKSYAESLPSVGYTGGNVYPYVKRHNPFAYFSDVLDSPAQANNLVPFTQFATDLASGQLPHYSFIVPNQVNNAHNCPSDNPNCTDAQKLAAADNWLKANIDPLIASPAFQQDGLLIITFDESNDTDTQHGGGHIATLVISPKAKQGYQSTTFYQHQSLLRLTAEALGLTSFPGAAATAPNMAEFFGGTNTAPLISTVTPNTGLTDGGTAVTINGTGFVTGATVSFGGTNATNVTVVGSTQITATTPAHSAGAVSVTVTNPNGQSATFANGFSYSSGGAPPETVLLADDFNNNSLDAAMWIANNLYSGFTDAGVALGEKNQRLEIGPLKQNASGSSYNGIRSAAAHNFTGAYAYVELAQMSPSSTAADAMFTIGRDVNAYYRIYVEAGALVCQKKIGSAKTNLSTTPYSATNHRFLRIRHDAATGNVIFEAAPNAGGVPGVWVQLASEPWNTAAMPLSAILFELKAGTWRVETTAPGTVIFDNFKAAKP